MTAKNLMLLGMICMTGLGCKEEKVTGKASGDA